MPKLEFVSYFSFRAHILEVFLYFGAIQFYLVMYILWWVQCFREEWRYPPIAGPFHAVPYSRPPNDSLLLMVHITTTCPHDFSDHKRIVSNRQLTKQLSQSPRGRNSVWPKMESLFSSLEMNVPCHKFRSHNS